MARPQCDTPLVVYRQYMSNPEIDLRIDLGLPKVELLYDDHVGNNVVSIFFV